MPRIKTKQIKPLREIKPGDFLRNIGMGTRIYLVIDAVYDDGNLEKLCIEKYGETNNGDFKFATRKNRRILPGCYHSWYTAVELFEVSYNGKRRRHKRKDSCLNTKS